MITLRGLSLQRGDRRLFSSVELTIHRGYTVGVVGANGVGKSSLLELLRGDLQPDEGDIIVSRNLEVASVSQETPSTARPAIEYVLDGDVRLRDLEHRLADTDLTRNGEQHAAMHAEYEVLGGYTASARAARILSGLGFSDDDLHKPLNRFSGGWQMRLNLAQALMCHSDLLLLDEPTNHLDLDAVLWLERWLQDYSGTSFVISHDREFLDNIAEHIAHLEHQQIGFYRGNYTAFEEQKAALLARQGALFEKQQREIAHMHAFVTRFRAKATKARQAQSRLKALERMETISAAHIQTPFNVSFFVPDKLPNPLVQLDKVGVGYDGTPLLRQVRLNIEPGLRLGLLGPNGAGKSTLMKLLAGRLEPISGAREQNKELKVAYFAQHQLDQLDPQISPLVHLQRLSPGVTEQALKNFLGGFGFRGERCFAPCAQFSGGEQARLVIAGLIWQRPNLLLLDEPTNHLDLEMRHALTRALQSYQGALVVVSHDRHLLRTTTDSLLLIANGQVVPYDGDIDDYRNWRLKEQSSSAFGPKPTTDRPSTSDRQTRRREAAIERQTRRPLLIRLKALETQMEQLQADRKELERALSDSVLYETHNKDRLKEVLLDNARLSEQMEETETEWLQAHEQLEAMDSKTIPPSLTLTRPRSSNDKNG